MQNFQTTRRGFVAFLAGTFATGLFPFRLQADDRDWITEVTTPPDAIPKPKRDLVPLLSDTTRTPEAWEQHRAVLFERWKEFLGTIDTPRPKPEFVVRSRERTGDIVRTLIEYESESGFTVPAYLLEPATKSDERRPGIVALHPTTSETIKPIAGLSGPEDKQSAIHLAQAGFIVLCPQNFLWQNAKDYNDAVAKFQARHPNSLGMAKMLYDAQQAVDILQSVDGVDPQRIGAFGHSLGAKEALYLAAFDNRIKCAVASEGGIAFDSTNWDADWYLGKEIRNPDFWMNHHQILAFIAPRPFLVLGGETGPGAADGERSWPYLAAAQDVYRLYDSQPKLGLLNHRQGHSIPPIARQRAIEWLSKFC